MENCVKNPGMKCIGAEKATRLESRIEQLEDWQKESKKFHGTIYDWQRAQIARDAKLDEQLSNMEKSLNKLVIRQEENDQKPGRRLDAFVDKTVWAIAAALITFFLAKFGL